MAVCVLRRDSAASLPHPSVHLRPDPPPTHSFAPQVPVQGSRSWGRQRRPDQGPLTASRLLLCLLRRLLLRLGKASFASTERAAAIPLVSALGPLASLCACAQFGGATVSPADMRRPCLYVGLCPFGRVPSSPSLLSPASSGSRSLLATPLLSLALPASTYTRVRHHPSEPVNTSQHLRGEVYCRGCARTPCGRGACAAETPGGVEATRWRLPLRRSAPRPPGHRSVITGACKIRILNKYAYKARQICMQSILSTMF